MIISPRPTSGDRVSAVVLRPAHIFGSYNDLDFAAADVLAGPFSAGSHLRHGRY